MSIEAEIQDLIFFENDAYIIARKPSGLLSEEDPAGNRNLRQILENYLNEKYPWKKQLICQLVNRLDKPVGGLLVCAKKPSVLKDLQHQFFIRKVRKYYLAVVEGKPKLETGSLQHYLAKSPENFKAVAVSPETEGAKIAKLEYTTLASNASYSLLQIQLLTGRFHQIRFQLSQMGNPIWNDEWYGAKREEAGPRIGLYSYYLAFNETQSGQFREYLCLPPAVIPWTEFQKDIIRHAESITDI
ncbi:MAG TPA: RNA pseudouridine synthase [Saprospiraceae bacterium]|nr:RNA pseudouridine synthase [Saprospiraceae bacterium]